jgi:NAD(P)-dependent dehydrogenase (short-subunit alcohol dehydrogenase family)
VRLQGKTALIIGATSGIGAAIEQAFAAEGAQYATTYPFVLLRRDKWLAKDDPSADQLFNFT